MEHFGRPLPNAVLLGAFCAATGRLRLESVEAAIREKFPGPVGEKNIAAARAAHELLAGAQQGEGVAGHAQAG